MTHVFVWTFKDVVGAVLLSILAIGALAYGALILYEKARRAIRRKLKGGK